jgi:hypothetical protein
MAALDWHAAEVAAPEAPRARPRPAPRRRSEARRVRGGIAWITVFAVLLVGVVAINVAVLRSNMALSNLDQQQLQLQAQNEALQSKLSSAGSSVRIERAAARLGLVQAPAADTSYLDLAGK